MSADSSADAETLADRTVVDADVHVDVPVDELADYCGKQHRGRVENPSTYPTDTGSDWITDDDRVDDDRRLRDPERVRDLVVEGMGIDYPILNVNSGIQKLPSTDLAVELMRAYNRYLLDRFLDDGDCYALAEITTQRPADAAEEIGLIAGEPGFVGVLVSSTGPDKPLGDPAYDVIYRAAADNDLPVVFHPNAGPHFRHDFPKQNQGFLSSFTIDTLSRLWSQTLSFTSVITQGVPEKFPELELLFLETGPAWVPYMTWRLNKEYSMQKPQAPLLAESPEEYVRRSCYFGTEPLGAGPPEQIGSMIDVVGADSLVFASNYPYGEVTGPDALNDHLAEWFGDGERAAITDRTPRELFGLPG